MMRSDTVSPAARADSIEPVADSMNALRSGSLVRSSMRVDTRNASGEWGVGSGESIDERGGERRGHSTMTN